jgi:putative transposase
MGRDRSKESASTTSLIFGRRHLEGGLGAYAKHYNRARPHRSLELRPPDPGIDSGVLLKTKVRRRDVLGGLIPEYRPTAAA